MLRVHGRELTRRRGAQVTRKVGLLGTGCGERL